MSAAQRLYEGVATDEGQVGLITYMRTDSVALSSQAMAEAARVIESRFGDGYATPKGRAFKTKTRNAQEAHEAIRPTSFWRDPEAAAKFLKSDEARLYRLIWQRLWRARWPPRRRRRPRPNLRPTAMTCGPQRPGPPSTASRASTPRPGRPGGRKRMQPSGAQGTGCHDRSGR